MQLTELSVGSKYKTVGKQEFKIENSEIDAIEVIPSGTIITPAKFNQKSVRVEFKFRDADRDNYTARLPFADNAGDFNLKEV
jgi:hypothetical protein